MKFRALTAICLVIISILGAAFAGVPQRVSRAASDFWGSRYQLSSAAAAPNKVPVPPGKDQDAKRNGLSLRVRQLVNSLDPLERKAAIAPKALFLANGARDEIDIESIKKFVKELTPSYKDHPDRLRLLEEPKTGHMVTDRMWSEGSQWLVRHLVEKPVRWSH